jgi:hypothetical protein
VFQRKDIAGGLSLDLDLRSPLNLRGEEAMRDYAVGMGVAIFIGLYIVYLYQPSFFENLYHHVFMH